MPIDCIRCPRCRRVMNERDEQWFYVDAEFDAACGTAYVCPGCVTYWEARQVNTNRRLRGLAELPVRAWQELPSLSL